MADLKGIVRTRFAPSPTGYVHIGSLRTALFGFLFARHNGGINILRIEDTDQGRLVQDAAENLVRTLHEMGIEFDEGYYWDTVSNTAKERGEFGPYLQSKRLTLYKEHAEQLLSSRQAYYCFCSSERLEELRAEQNALKKPPMYDRQCRNLPAADSEHLLLEFEKANKKPVIRQATPMEGETVFTDLVYGTVTVQHKLLDDQILIKSDGFPTYNFANIIDDHYMQITHVIRGEEFVPTTPKHILLYQAFGWRTPEFIHLPLILSQDKTKLGKRHGDVSVESFIQAGYLKEALINFVALLGWNPKTEQELFSMDELIAQFDVGKIHKAGAIFDRTKLEWTNSNYIRQKSITELATLLVPYWKKDGYLEERDGQLIIKAYATPASSAYLETIAQVEQERLKKLSEIGERTAYFFNTPTYNPELLTWKKSTPADAKEKLSLLKEFIGTLDIATLIDSAKIQEALMRYIKEQGFDTGSVLWPLRVALTGMQASPSPSEVTATLAIGLGKAEVLARIETAMQSIG